MRRQAHTFFLHDPFRQSFYCIQSQNINLFSNRSHSEAMDESNCAKGPRNVNKTFFFFSLRRVFFLGGLRAIFSLGFTFHFSVSMISSCSKKGKRSSIFSVFAPVLIFGVHTCQHAPCECKYVRPQASPTLTFQCKFWHYLQRLNFMLKQNKIKNLNSTRCAHDAEKTAAVNAITYCALFSPGEKRGKTTPHAPSIYWGQEIFLLS